MTLYESIRQFNVDEMADYLTHLQIDTFVNYVHAMDGMSNNRMIDTVKANLFNLKAAWSKMLDEEYSEEEPDE